MFLDIKQMHMQLMHSEACFACRYLIPESLWLGLICSPFEKGSKGIFLTEGVERLVTAQGVWVELAWPWQDGKS